MGTTLHTISTDQRELLKISFIHMAYKMIANNSYRDVTELESNTMKLKNLIRTKDYVIDKSDLPEITVRLDKELIRFSIRDNKYCCELFELLQDTGLLHPILCSVNTKSDYSTLCSILDRWFISNNVNVPRRSLEMFVGILEKTNIERTKGEEAIKLLKQQLVEKEVIVPQLI